VTTQIAAYFLGGTISMLGQGNGIAVRLGGQELLTAVPQLSDLDVELQAHPFRALPSAALSFADIAELVTHARTGGADGIVVVQGTDTIEESAYLIDLLWDSPVPIVVTGAMRNPSLAGADGPANLLAAVTVAAHEAFSGLGALVVFADEVHAARFVRKSHTSSTATFVSSNAGPIGLLSEGQPVLLTSVTRRPVYPSVGGFHARVPLLAVGMDDDPGALPALAEGCSGLVVAGLGGGHVPPSWASPLGELAGRLPVVLASRTGAGAVLAHTYGAPGAEIDLLGRGLIGAGMLDPYKARVLLRVLLAAQVVPDRAQLSAAFAAAC
jgi:L-asparaginase